MKGSYICILSVFVTLIASAQSTECRRCWNVGRMECWPDDTTTCPTDQCMSILENSLLDDKEYTTIRKACGDSTICDGCFSVSTNCGITVRVSSECRTGDLSNDDLAYNIGCEDLQYENGYECPACYNNSSADGCEPTGTVKCSGAETECLVYKGIIQLADGSVQAVSVRGCITRGGCNLGFSALPGAKEVKQYELTCNPASQASGGEEED